MDERSTNFRSLQAARMQKLSPASKLFRLALVIVILGIPSFLCGLMGGFKIVLAFWLFFLIVLGTFAVGFYLILRYAKERQKLSFLLTTGLIGFIFFELALVGMLLDDRVKDFSWQYILGVALGIGIVAFCFNTIFSLVYSSMFRRMNQTKFKGR